MYKITGSHNISLATTHIDSNDICHSKECRQAGIYLSKKPGILSFIWLLIISLDISFANYGTCMS